MPLERDDIENLINVAKLDWSAIEPSIFGTLFERGLDPAKRSQLGAHYTDPVSIMRIVNPVIVEPLLAEWLIAKTDIAALMATFHECQTSRKAKATTALKEATKRYIEFKERLKNFKVLDPACGSGNFLYLALQALKDIELRVGLEAEELGLERGFPEVGPQAMHGIEISPYAAELAKVTVWIGDIQWMLKHGFAPSREPILKTLDQIQCRDALLASPFSPLPLGEGSGVRESGEIASTSPSSPALLPEGEGSKSIPALENGKRKINPPLPADLKTYARNMRASPTDAEAFIWGALRARRMAGFKFRRQHPVERFILDFYCHDLQLAIELDGGQHQDNINYDQTRSAALAAGGIRMVRFWNNDVLANPESVLEAIWNELQLLSPLLPGEGPWVREPGGIASTSPSSPALLPEGEGSKTIPEGAGSKPVRRTEAIWPKVDAIIGNPPFLGGSKMREELGDDYTEALRAEYAGRVPGGADLVCYWFAKAHACVNGNATRAGLVATNSIRQSTNRPVLERIVADGEIYNAWSDQEWVNEGAAVRVSIVCFEGNASTSHRHIERSEISAVVGREETSTADSSAKAPRHDKFLDGRVVTRINADLTGDDVGASALDITQAKPLKQNAGRSFPGSKKHGAFDIDGELAREWLRQPNPHGKPNSDTLKPSLNGLDLMRRARGKWMIDFGTRMTETEAALYETPFQHVAQNVKPEREKNNREQYRTFWWRHGEPRIALRASILGFNRYIATPEVAKHRAFVWLQQPILPDNTLIVIARDDDTTFGILSSRLHVAWALAVGGRMGKGNDPRYNPTLCFQTFPFPEGLTPNLNPAQYTNPHAAGIATAAAHLNQLRENWLNPPEWVDVIPEVLPSPAGRGAGGEGNGSSEGKPIPYPDRIIPKPEFAKAIKDRTLTNLYNARAKGEVQWLDDAHRALDAAVAAAYGWVDYLPEMADDEILRRLLALNLARA